MHLCTGALVRWLYYADSIPESVTWENNDVRSRMCGLRFQKKIRRKARIIPGPPVAVAHKLVPRLEEIHEIPFPGGENRIGGQIRFN